MIKVKSQCMFILVIKKSRVKLSAFVSPRQVSGTFRTQKFGVPPAGAVAGGVIDEE